MLATETYTIDEALDELEEGITALEDKLDELDSSTDEHEAIQSRRDRLTYFRDGLKWQRDEEEWGNAEITLGALTAGQKAIMHRAIPDNADSEERLLWFMAASTVDAPYAVSRDPDKDDLTKSIVDDNFAGIAGPGIHGGFVQWAEGKTNSLGVPGGSGNRSSTSSPEAEASTTSTDGQSSTTTSSSDSPTE